MIEIFVLDYFILCFDLNGVFFPAFFYTILLRTVGFLNVLEGMSYF